MFIISFALSIGCTANSRARNWGGTETIHLPKGKTLVTATWKQTELWYLVRDRRPDEKPETHQFKEKSSFGMLEGTVTFIEE